MKANNYRNINILYIIWSLDIGGEEVILLELVKRLNKSKYQTLVCSLSPFNDLIEEFRKNGIKVAIIEKRFKFDLAIIPKLMKLMKRYKIDLVHTLASTANYWGRLSARLKGIPIILAKEANLEVKRSYIANQIDRYLSFFTDVIIVNSSATKEFLVKKKGIKPDKIIMIHEGIDVSEFNMQIDCSPQKREFNIGKDTPVVGIIGRLAPQKNHKMFLDAARIIFERLPQTKFLIVGGGALRETLESYSRKLGLASNVLFTGAREEREDIIEMYKIIDVFALSSSWEGSPYVLKEAMAAGKPIVATDVGGNSEIVTDGETGYIVPPENPEAFVEAILKILEDKELAKKMGLAGRRRMEQYFSVEKMVQQVEELYDSLVREKIKINKNL